MELSTILWIVLITVVVVGLFVLGISLTLMVKGHNIDSEIGTNRNMQKLGIKCAAQQMRDEERALRGEKACDLPHDCSPSGCGTCLTGLQDK